MKEVNASQLSVFMFFWRLTLDLIVRITIMQLIFGFFEVVDNLEKYEI
jgi:hypothetical protein